MIGLIIQAVAFVMLVCFWLISEFEGRGKLIVTGIYLLTWSLVFVDAWALIGAQTLFAFVIGTMTFATGRR